jgi:hypothetical protein
MAGAKTNWNRSQEFMLEKKRRKEEKKKSEDGFFVG